MRPDEHDALAGIARALHDSDPDLARRLTTPPPPTPRGARRRAGAGGDAVLHAAALTLLWLLGISMSTTLLVLAVATGGRRRWSTHLGVHGGGAHADPDIAQAAATRPSGVQGGSGRRARTGPTGIPAGHRAVTDPP